MQLRDIMKLTALFTALRGHGFLAALSQREGRNYQFDFLRPNHSLFGYFNRHVEQYQKVLYPSKEMLAQLNERTQQDAQWKILEQSRKYAKWEQQKREKDKKRQDDQEAEKRRRCMQLHRAVILMSFQVHLQKSIGTIMLSFRLLNSP